MSPLYLIGSLMALTILHELGHVLSALALRLKIFKVGIAPLPYPHPYVKVEHTANRLHRYIFYYSGMGMTVGLMLLCYFTGVLSHKFLYFAFAIELIIELNPFYSDVFLVNTDMEDYGKFNFGLSGKRSIYLVCWLLLVYFLLSPFGLQSILN